jgi:hypothetical protein
MNHQIRTAKFAAALLALIVAVACKTFSPAPIEDVAFNDRLQTKTRGDVTVSVSVLTAEEAKEAFDIKLYKKKIQPVWIEIENNRDEPVWFLPASVDPDYVPPLEAAYRSRWTWHKKENRKMAYYFYEQGMRFEVPANSTAVGFVHATRRLGARLVVVDLIGEDYVERFDFVVEIPGFKADYLRAIEHEDEILGNQEIVDLSDNEMKEWIENLPCCVTNAKGTKTGDPLNLVIIGENEAVWPAFLRARWEPTASLGTGSALKTGVFGLFGGRYANAPVSSLYVFGRQQDIALQKARHNVHLRNHLRLWLAPVTFRGLPLWVGQISRDIGTRMTTKSSTLTTHKIDPDVDETRASLTQDFLYPQALAAFTYAPGVGEYTVDSPGRNLTGDPFFTDGNRAVMVLVKEPVSIRDVEFFHWEEPTQE